MLVVLLLLLYYFFYYHYYFDIICVMIVWLHVGAPSIGRMRLVGGASLIRAAAIGLAGAIKPAIWHNTGTQQAETRRV